MLSIHPMRSVAAGAASPARSSTRPRVLIAEDNGDIREMLQLLFETNGFEVVAADDGPHALQLALQTPPTLILIDLQLPTLDGLSVIRELRQHQNLRGVRIAVVSGHDPARYRPEAIEAGCDEYLQKPIDFDRLEKLLDR